ncbi:MAG: DUF2851 family protein [Bacteroidetes bacterium]|nr:DUF2851 family protein [Bacteroidota bacterium]
MTEDFLHFLWKFGLIEQPLLLTTGESCVIVKPGLHNTHSGPDFLDARIRIDGTLWAGNVEVHIHASDWYRHDHHHDEVYDNIILHVVFLEDKTVRRKSGESIPTVELSGKFEERLLQNYQLLMRNKSWIPCAPLIGTVDRFTRNNWIDRVLVERLEHRTHEINERLEFNSRNWSETFYQMLARNFGFRVNALPFELLARSLPMNILAKHKDHPDQIEALLFGQAGMLSVKSKDEYYLKLKREYEFLATKYNLKPLDGHIWRFMRLRPSNFPTIRLSQFSALIHQSSHLWSRILEAETIRELTLLFQCNASAYWTDHYTFGKLNRGKAKKLGKAGINLILINTVIPFLFAYGKLRGLPDYVDRALKFLDQVPGESNSMIRQWKELGMNIRSAFLTQALIELKQAYCDSKRCLHCAIGARLINGGTE